MAKLFANSGDFDQTPHSVVSDLGLHCLSITFLRVCQLQWVKGLSLSKKSVNRLTDRLDMTLIVLSRW